MAMSAARRTRKKVKQKEGEKVKKDKEGSISQTEIGDAGAAAVDEPCSKSK